jgi:hypothetical protein
MSRMLTKDETAELRKGTPQAIAYVLEKYDRQICYELAISPQGRLERPTRLLILTEDTIPLFYQEEAFLDDIAIFKRMMGGAGELLDAYLEDYWSIFPAAGPKKMCGAWEEGAHCRVLLGKHSPGRCQRHAVNREIKPIDTELQEMWPGLVKKYGRAALLIKNVPPRLREIYLESLGTTGNNMSLFAEIAIATVRQQELLQRAWENDPVKALMEVRSMMGRLKQQYDKTGELDIKEMITGIVGVVEAAEGGEKAWDAWAKVTELTRRLIETEQRRIVRAQEAMTLDELEQMAIQQERQIRLAANEAAGELAEGDEPLRREIERVILEAIARNIDHHGRGEAIVMMEQSSHVSR